MIKTFNTRKIVPKTWARAIWMEPDGEEEGTIPMPWIDEEKRKVYWPSNISSKSAARRWLLPTPDWLIFDLIVIKCRGDQQTCEAYDFPTDNESTSVPVSLPMSPSLLSPSPGPSTSLSKSNENVEQNKEVFLSSCTDTLTAAIERANNFEKSRNTQVLASSHAYQSGQSGGEESSENFRNTKQQTGHVSHSGQSRKIVNDITPTTGVKRGIDFQSSSEKKTTTGDAKRLKDGTNQRQENAERNRSSNNDAYPISEARFQRKVLYKLTQIVGYLEDISSRVSMTPGVAMEIRQLSTMDDFDDLCEKLVSDNEAKISRLSQIGGDNLGDCTRSTLRKLMTSSLMSLFNMDGTGEKRSFKSTPVFDCVLRAIREVFRGECEKDVTKSIQDTLKHAPARVKKEKS